MKPLFLWEIFGGHVGKCAEGFESVHRGASYWEKKCRRKKIAGVL